jgi:hypothetical protein
MARQERVKVSFLNLINAFLPYEWKDLDGTSVPRWDDEEWVLEYKKALDKAAMIVLSQTDPSGETFELPSFLYELSASSEKRFLTLTTGDTPQPWLARQLMDSRGLLEGNMHRPDLRRISGTFDPKDKDKVKTRSVKKRTGQGRK